jgi:hypothetical protein
LLQDIGSSVYSLIIDESTDISVVKMLGVIIRYVSRDKKKIISTYLGLLPLADGTAATIVATLDSYLQEIRLSPKKCVGIGTDNAAVMVGSQAGVHKLLQVKWEKPLTLIPCACHGIQLAVSSASLELPSSLEFLIRETYNWFSHSSIRQHKYKTLFQALNNKEPLKIVQVCDVRWLSIFVAIDRILDQYSTLEKHFLITRVTEKCYTANQLHEMFADKKNFCYLLFLRKVLLPVYQTNKIFESNNNPFQIIDDLLKLVVTIGNFALNKAARYDIMTENDLISFRDPNPNFGFIFEEEFKKLDPTIAFDVRERCFKFLFKLIHELRNRLPKNYYILNIMKEMTISRTLRVIKPNIINKNLINEFGIPLGVADRIETQWTNIINVEWTERLDSFKFWFEVYDFIDSTGSHPYRELAEFVFTVISLPLGNADVERLFSQMNVVKTKKRNRMRLPLMNGLLLTKYGLRLKSKKCYEYELPEDVLLKIGSSQKYLTKKSENEDNRENFIHLCFDEDNNNNNDNDEYFEEGDDDDFNLYF